MQHFFFPFGLFGSFISLSPVHSALIFLLLISSLFVLLKSCFATDEKPPVMSKIVSVLASGLQGEISPNEWSDNHRLRRGRWRDGQMALSSSERTRYHRDHSSIPPTCFRGRKMLSFLFKCHRQMKLRD